jgi:hypothetical protein
MYVMPPPATGAIFSAGDASPAINFIAARQFAPRLATFADRRLALSRLRNFPANFFFFFFFFTRPRVPRRFSGYKFYNRALTGTVRIIYAIPLRFHSPSFHLPGDKSHGTCLKN